MEAVNIVDSLAKHASKKYGRRSLDRIRSCVVHHSGNTSGSPESFARYHVNTHGWPGIGYHFVIDKDATIYLTQYLDTNSYHTSGNNTAAFGICVIGNYEIEVPKHKVIQALVGLINDVRLILPPFEVRGHLDYVNTDCPGKNLYPLLSKLFA